MSERDDEPTTLGLLVNDQERSSVPSITGPAIPPRPERARRTGRTLVIDAFLVRATEDPVDHGHAANAVRLEEEDDLLEDRRILAHITLRHEVAPEVRRGVVLLRDHRGDQLRRPTIIRAVEGDGPDRKAAKAPLRLLPKPLVQLPRSAGRYHRHNTRAADQCPKSTGSGDAVKSVLLRAEDRSSRQSLGTASSRHRSRSWHARPCTNEGTRHGTRRSSRGQCGSRATLGRGLVRGHGRVRGTASADHHRAAEDVRGGEAREAAAKRRCGQSGRPASLTLHPSSSSSRPGYCAGASPTRLSTRG